MLTTRQYFIVMKLLDAKSAIRIDDLSIEYGVSTRTIKYDLETIKDWFQKRGVEYYSLRNKGIGINYEEQQRGELRRIVLLQEREHVVKDQEQRVLHIIGRLLLSTDYMTANDLALDLDMSRNTILSDLNGVEQYVEMWLVKLIRKPRFGYSLEGEELYIRLLFQHLVHKKLTNHDVYAITQKIQGNLTIDEPQLLFLEPFHSIYGIVNAQLRTFYDKKMIKTLSHKELITILVRLSISFTRIQLGKAIGSYRILRILEEQDVKTKYITTTMQCISEDLSFPMLEDEYLYITDGMKTGWEAMDIAKITEQIIAYVSKKENIAYSRDEKLYSNMLSHLTSRFHQGTTYLIEENPFDEEIKSNYPHLFQNIKKAVVEYVSPYGIIIQDTFISFLALHFLVSYEKATKQRNQVHALYVCSTSRGVARIIKNRVESEVRNIDIVAYCSILEVEQICKLKTVDVIISVFPLEASVPVLVVEAIPTKNDIEQIKKFVSNAGFKTQQDILPAKEIHFSEHKQVSIEDVSEELIVKGFQLASQLSSLFENHLLSERKQAFMMHIFLMVHRCYFYKQYDQFYLQRENMLEGFEEYKETIEDMANEVGITLNEAEIMALLQYIR